MPDPVLSFYTMAPEVTAFSSTRKGGVSTGNYGAFNINQYCGDDAEHVRQNRESLCQALGLSDVSRLVMPHQVHGVEVRQITSDFLDLPATERTSLLEGVDAVMTDVPEVCVGVSTADCIPVLLYDAAHHAACAIHAGWRGTVARIAQKAVEAMTQAYHTRPETLKACIGPGISLKNFEVGDEVYQQFAEAGFDMSQISRRQAKWHIDLWACNRLQLLDMGLPAEQIQLSGVCTYDCCDEYFSARRLGIQSGRIFTGILMTA